jgi:monomeric isocitrate dehydrogenase
MRSMSSKAAKPTITYTETDEAPMLATYSFLPIVRKLAGMAGIDVEKVAQLKMPTL